MKATALATVKEAREKIDQDAAEITANWFAEHRVAIKGLPDDRQQAYDEIRAMAVHPQRTYLSRPRTRLEDFAEVDNDGQIKVAQVAPLHLMSDENGDFPLSTLNDWEKPVVRAELARPGVIGWYRNPPRQAADSLGVAYRDSNGNWRSMHPDFIFFHDVGGKIRASIVDPHGHHLDDADAKLKALVAFALEHGGHFHRVESLSMVNGKMRVLDLQSDDVRQAVLDNTGSVEALYNSNAAVDYDGA